MGFFVLAKGLAHSHEIPLHIQYIVRDLEQETI